jgi:hypothetical protein
MSFINYEMEVGNRLELNIFERECGQLSGSTKFPESRSFVFNLFPGFSCIMAALKSRIIARKSRTKLMLKFVRDISTKMPLCPLYA